MEWPLFYRKRRPARGKERDEFDEFIDIIEAFAPKEHPSEREACYYNYRMMALYRKPLLVLLETISQRDRMKADPTAFARDLFLRLKDFYDPRNRLSLKQAIRDRDLLQKFRDLFLYFYGTRDLPVRDMETWIQDA